MSSFWPPTTAAKLSLTALGMIVIFATSTPQTPQYASAYLAEQGYSGVRLGPHAPYHGRGRKRFPFEARDMGGKAVIGELSMGSFSWFYTVTLNRAPPLIAAP